MQFPTSFFQFRMPLNRKEVEERTTSLTCFEPTEPRLLRWRQRPPQGESWGLNVRVAARVPACLSGNPLRMREVAAGLRACWTAPCGCHRRERFMTASPKAGATAFECYFFAADASSNFLMNLEGSNKKSFEHPSQQNDTRQSGFPFSR
jgi:hypothetical protein